MSAHPFSSELRAQLASLDSNMKLLRRFSEQYQNLPAPFACSACGPSVYFGAESIADVGYILGHEGWTCEETLIWRECFGVRIEIKLPSRRMSSPFAWDCLTEAK